MLLLQFLVVMPSVCVGRKRQWGCGKCLFGRGCLQHFCNVVALYACLGQSPFITRLPTAELAVWENSEARWHVQAEIDTRDAWCCILKRPQTLVFHGVSKRSCRRTGACHKRQKDAKRRKKTQESERKEHKSFKAEWRTYMVLVLIS